jgi:8-oxo-dGTP pyrophosphatase MutT (NUDIX family)
MGLSGSFGVITLLTLCFIHDDRRVLLIHRRRQPNAGRWDGVGGKVEAGEDPFAGCIREVREETGLVIGSPALRALWVVTARDSGQIWILFTFTAAVPEGELVTSDEGDVEWVSLDRLDELRVMPDTRLVLPHVLATSGVLTIREEMETEDIDSMTRLEILSPPSSAGILFPV